MAWFVKIWGIFLGCLYSFLALALSILFVPTLVAFIACMLFVCVFSPTFFKQVTVWSFNKTMTMITSLVGMAAASFRDSRNATL